MAVHLSNSMIKVKTGFTDGGSADTIYVDADSNLYLSFDFFLKEIGVNATFRIMVMLILSTWLMLVELVLPLMLMFWQENWWFKWNDC